MKFETTTVQHTRTQAFLERRKFYDTANIIATLSITANFNESRAYSVCSKDRWIL